MYIYHKNTRVYDIERDSVLNYELLPIALKTGFTFDSWVKSRSADTSRASIRILKKSLRIKNNIVIFNKCRSVTDNYWIGGNDNMVPDISKDTTYFDIIDKKEYIDIINPEINPELTAIGASDKAWYYDNMWKLLKIQPPKECYNELRTFNIGSKLGFDMASYKLINENKILTDSFIKDGYDLQHMWSYIGEDEDIARTLAILENYNLEDKFKDILFLDALVINPDRHTFNYGVITKDGEVVSLAPNYDNNLSFSGKSNRYLAELFKEVGYYKPPIESSIPKDLRENYSNIIRGLRTSRFN